jgi:hypothetical protein
MGPQLFSQLITSGRLHHPAEMLGSTEVVRLIIQIVPQGFDDELGEFVSLPDVPTRPGDALGDG